MFTNLPPMLAQQDQLSMCSDMLDAARAGRVAEPKEFGLELQICDWEFRKRPVMIVDEKSWGSPEPEPLSIFVPMDPRAAARVKEAGYTVVPEPEPAAKPAQRMFEVRPAGPGLQIDMNSGFGLLSPIPQRKGLLG